MNRFYILIFLFFVAGMFSVSAQDLVILKDGTIIEAKVTEISQADIRYRRFDHLDGPVIVIQRANVLVIRYENGTNQVISPGTATQQNTQTAQTTAIDPDKFTFAFNFNPASILTESGSSLCLEFGKRKFNAEVNLFFPFLSPNFDYGFGGLVTFNYFGHSRIGGVYVGGGLGIIYAGYEITGYEYDSIWNGYTYVPSQRLVTHYSDIFIFTLGLNAGYKFVTKSGIYFRTGGFLGLAFIDDYYRGDTISFVSAYFKPDLTLGYCF